MLIENKGNPAHPLQSCFAPISEFDELVYVYNTKYIIQYGVMFNFNNFYTVVYYTKQTFHAAVIIII